MTPLPTRGWEAHLQHDPITRHLKFVLYRPVPGYGGDFVQKIDETGALSLRVPIEEGLAEPGDKPLQIPEDIAAALFGALLEHFGGRGADRELRADYLHERGRVDRLIELVTRPPQVIRYDTGQVQAQ